jgi:hypothetical protein
MATCIWCLTENAEPSVEHIIPDALGCPEHFVLSGGTVCKRCNNGLAHLDRAVIDDFDMVAYMANVPRKRGRPPIVNTRGNLRATHGANGPLIAINMERETKTASDGAALGAFGRSPRNVTATLTRDGNLGRVSFSIPIGQSREFVRGITKIAFSSLAYFHGPESVLSNQFAPVRDFVRNGLGHRPVLMLVPHDAAYRHEVCRPFQTGSGDYLIVFRLAVMEFMVDLGPTLSAIPIVAKELQEDQGYKGWSWLGAPSDQQS